MPIAFVASRSSASVASAGFDEPMDMAAGASITVGNTLLLFMAYNNSGTTGVDPNAYVADSALVTALPFYDLRGNLWTRLAHAVRDPGNDDEGAVADVWQCHVQFPYSNGDDITVQFSFSTTALSYAIHEFSGIRPLSYSSPAAASGTGSSATIGGLSVTPATAGDMIIGIAAIETNTAITGDADTTDGSWAAIATQLYNSGSDLTSMTLSVQRKIVTGTSAQTWTITKTGASDYATVLVALVAQVDVADGFLSGNPDYPCIAGPQILPIGITNQPVDSGSEYLFTHKVFPNSWGTQDYNADTQLSSDPEGVTSSTIQQHVVAYDVYLAGDELIEDSVETVVCSVLAAGTASGASVSSGTAADALARPGSEYVILPNGGYVDVLFDPSALTAFYPNHRITRWALRYLAWKDDGATASPGEGIQVQWVDLSASDGNGAASPLGAWLTPNYRSGVQYDTRYLGEHNPSVRGKGLLVNNELKQGASFTVNDLSHMAAGDQTTRIRILGMSGPDPSQTTVYLDYCELIVELIPERRLASGHRRVCNAPIVSVPPGVPELYPTGSFGVPLWTALNTNTRWRVPAADNTYVLAVREIQPSSPSDYYAVEAANDPDLDRRVGVGESLGPPYFMRGVRNARETLVNAAEDGQPVLSRAPLTYGVIAAEPVSLDDDFLLGTVAYDEQRYILDGSFFPGYTLEEFGNLGYVYASNSKTQYIVVDGATTYDRIKLLVRPDALTTAALTLSVEQPLATPIATATISRAVADAAADVGNGWKEVSVALSVPITPSAGRVAVVASSTTTVSAPWHWQFGAPVALYAPFGYDVDNFATLATSTDYAVVLQCELAVPALVFDSATSEIFRPDGRCLETAVNSPEITITNSDDYDWIVVERSVDGGASWVSIAVWEPVSPNEQIVDRTAPWDLPAGSLSYRVTGWRDADRRSEFTVDVWNATASNPGAAFGFGLPGILSGNPTYDTPGELWAYVLSEDSGALTVPWSPLNPISMVQLHGVDYQVALRSPEERGLSVRVPIIVDKLLCVLEPEESGEFAPEIVSPGRQAMTPTPFADLQRLEGYSRVGLMLPGGHTRQVSVDISSSMNVRTARGIYATEIEITDVIPPDSDPYS